MRGPRTASPQASQWVDGQGRTIRFDQRMDMRGTSGANKVPFSEFGPVETFAAPTAG
ncbi:hypothetical protein ACGFNX_02490 [Streptomyces sp. NPDC048723]|uniref:hypothetical protein n=1 Tax=Streptomyces sp. NPDC048723 TaxID=3365589 RepID=UPI00371942FA